jgi:hypothetical protein
MRATVAITVLAIFMVIASIASASPALSSPKVLPTTGTSGDVFTFTVHYKGDSPVSVTFYADNAPLEMQEVDPGDQNYTDGKDYFIRVNLEEGTTIYYFKATTAAGEETRTAATTINVQPPEGLRVDHIDVVLAVLIFLIPTVWGLVMFRRLSKDLRETMQILKERKKSE